MKLEPKGGWILFCGVALIIGGSMSYMLPWPWSMVGSILAGVALGLLWPMA